MPKNTIDPVKEFFERRITAEKLIKNTQPQNMYTPQDREKKALKIGKWSVKINGTMQYDGGRYTITGKRLKEDDWIAHLFEKGWIDFNEFIPAYFQALKNIGQEFINIRVFY